MPTRLMMASAMIERAELPVHRKSTFNGRFAWFSFVSSLTFTNNSGFLDRRAAEFGLPLAAILGEEVEKLAHPIDMHGIAHIAPVARGVDKPGPVEFLEMKGAAVGLIPTRSAIAHAATPEGLWRTSSRKMCRR